MGKSTELYYEDCISSALLAGCLVLGFGVYLEVLADVVMLPGESFVRAIVQTWNTNFGTTKIVFDSSMAIIAGVLSFVFSGKLNGVREGTIIAAVEYVYGKYQMSNAETISARPEEIQSLKKLVPVYPLTEGIRLQQMQKMQKMLRWQMV